MQVRLLFLFLAVTFTAQSQAFAKAKTPYEQVKSYLRVIHAQYPQSTRLFTLGKSDGGSDILGILIGQGEQANLVVATHHGNEYGSTEVAKALILELAKNPLPNQSVYVIPVLNITGYNANQRWEKVRHYNWDPNRDYPGPCGNNRHFMKSTVLLDQFLGRQNIITAISLHTYGKVVAYPWSADVVEPNSSKLHPVDQNIFENLVNSAATVNGYRTGGIRKMIYPANGTFEDFAYAKYGIWSILFELGTSHKPNPEEVRNLISSNVPAVIEVLKNSPDARSNNNAFKNTCYPKNRGE